ncbi:hypothetical protein [Nodosilinea sp. P-1105]|uniref:hypothetical protein n=1 Tax=Nodosilinea sp. P-1105 TaxID=2546229 RepID=UPI00146C35EA|nr:hypothetical protein [Nodosilinea sp. P-1105]NMF84142.1 hypothetical protein [Nodosilinea sp. P-1105]
MVSLVTVPQKDASSTKSEEPRDRIGFRDGFRGTHSSRTMMFAELQALLNSTPADAAKQAYQDAIIEDNLLGKPTLSSRKLTAQKLTELYGLEPKIPLFRLMRHYWALADQAQPQIALLAALARDPLLRTSMDVVLETVPGEALSAQAVEQAIADQNPHRFSEKTLSSIARNIRSTWTQSGHLSGYRQPQKIRTAIQATPASVAYAVAIGYLEGHRGQLLLETKWIKVLDLNPSVAKQLVQEASRRGWLVYRGIGDMIDISLPNLFTVEEEKWLQ